MQGKRALHGEFVLGTVKPRAACGEPRRISPAAEMQEHADARDEHVAVVLLVFGNGIKFTERVAVEAEEHVAFRGLERTARGHGVLLRIVGQRQHGAVWDLASPVPLDSQGGATGARGCGATENPRVENSLARIAAGLHTHALQ